MSNLLKVKLLALALNENYIQIYHLPKHYRRTGYTMENQLARGHVSKVEQAFN